MSSRVEAGALAAAAVGSFMTTFGTGLLNVAAPAIQAHFAISVAQTGWIFTAYLLAQSAVLLVCGRWGDVVGFDRVLAVGLLGVSGAVVLCAFSWQFWVLLCGRLLHGAFAGLLTAGSPALVTTTLPAERRAHGLGVLGMCTYVGLGAGPVAGGLLTGCFGWRAVFVVNLAVALVGSWLVRSVSAERGLPARPLSFEALNPLAPLVLLRAPDFRHGLASASLLYVASFLTLFVLPFELRDDWHFDPARIGLLLTLPPVLMALAAPLSSAASRRFGPRAPSIAGLVLLAASVVAVARSAAWASGALLLLGLAGIGSGHGLFTTANNIAVLGSARAEQQGGASALLAIARCVGMTGGVTLGGALFSWLRASVAKDPRLALSHTLFAGSLLAVVAAALTWAASPRERSSVARF